MKLYTALHCDNLRYTYPFLMQESRIGFCRLRRAYSPVLPLQTKPKKKEILLNKRKVDNFK